MANHTVTFPITDEQEILKLRAGDEVTVQGHIIGIRDRTQIRIFDQGVEPPMDLRGAFLLHTAPNVRKIAEGKYEKICIGTTTSARMVRFTEGLGAEYGVRGFVMAYRTDLTPAWPNPFWTIPPAGTSWRSLARLVGGELKSAHGADRNIGGDLGPLRTFRNPSAVGTEVTEK